MRKLVFFVLAIVLFRPVFSQNNSIDNLKLRLQTGKQDTMRVMILRDLAVSYLSALQYDSVLTYLRQGMELAEKLKYKRGIAALMNTKGGFVSDHGNMAEGLKLYLGAMAINEELGEYDGLCRNLNNIGVVYKRMGDLESALQYFLRAEDAYNKAKKIYPGINLSPPTINIASTYMSMKKLDSAKFYAQKVYEEGRTANDYTQISSGLRWLGNIYKETGENGIALEYYRSGEAYSKLAGNVPRPLVWGAIGSLFEKTGDLDSALFYGRLAITATSLKENVIHMVGPARLLARVHTKLGNPDSANYYYQLAITANDTLLARQSSSEISNSLLNEKLRQEEKAEAEIKSAAQRKQNLQYAAMALGLVVFLLLFFILSHSTMANDRVISFLGILALLIVFEFLNLLLHPYISKLTNHSPLLMLACMVAIAALLIPLHHRLQHWITIRLVEKNKKIRLAAARKTIQKLES
jgi:tetratricopeptide (TPR) repeat protein